MSNQAEIDYEKQFQEDLAKATALSLEQEALDEYRRSKKYGTSANAYYERSQSTQHDSSYYYAQLRNRNIARGNSMTPPPLAALPTQSQRRHSEISNAPIATTNTATFTPREQSKTPPPSLPESDLISFASPTSKNSENNTFEKLIEDLQKMQASNTQTALVPLGPTAAAPMHPNYRSVNPALIYRPQQQYVPGPAGMQIVPFTPPTSQSKVPLTNEELQKLYSMPHTQTTAYPHHMGFIPSTGYYPPGSHMVGTITPGSMPAAYLPPQYGFHYNTLSASAVNAPYATYAQSSSNIAQANNYDASNILNTNVPKISKSHSASNVNTSNGTGDATMLRMQTPPARKQRTGEDLIDLSHEDDSRVSVLEAFDPLLNENNGVWKK